MFSSRCDQAVHGDIKMGEFAVLWKHFLTCQLVLITFYTSDSYEIYMDRYGLMSATYISKPNLNFYIPIYILLTSCWEGWGGGVIVITPMWMGIIQSPGKSFEALPSFELQLAFQCFE